MCTPEEFPYIKSLYVNDCYAYKDFAIELHDYKPFSHLILTGKNGSGKSTILRSIHRQVYLQNINKNNLSAVARNLNSTEDTITVNESTFSSVETIRRVLISFLFAYQLNKDKSGEREMMPSEVLGLYRDKIYSYFPAKRSSNVDEVEAPSKEKEFAEKLDSQDSTE